VRPYARFHSPKLVIVKHVLNCIFPQECNDTVMTLQDTPHYLSKQEIDALNPAGATPDFPDDLARPLRDNIRKHGEFTPEQLAGRVFPVACVALEITQRCNLDCTLCYLSDLAEAVKDVPLFELERRLDMIHTHYGDNTNIQITGGDPTLRSISDLVKIVEMIKARNMRSALFTNGIKASRNMLEVLSRAGLNDVVFHVDLTQERKGYDSEAQLNDIRLEYINRAKGMPLRVMFNTTVFEGNFREIPDLVSFFTDHAKRIDLSSFQLQADTGRGVLRERNAQLITQESVMQQLRNGTGLDLNFDYPMIGHSDCNKYTSIMVSGKTRTVLFDDREFFNSLFEMVGKAGGNWAQPSSVIPRAILRALGSPRVLWGGAKFWVRKFWALKNGIVRGKGMHRINFFIHNFMDAEKLECARCESCVFMVATTQGTLSMCVHNAKRDQMISSPSKDKGGNIIWNPLDPTTDTGSLPIKKLKGRLRDKADRKRQLVK